MRIKSSDNQGRGSRPQMPSRVDLVLVGFVLGVAFASVLELVRGAA